ncbi:MAG: VOC family protein [Ardenticatenaceae bacterium]|nr:VOC family protein [Ardenticatenaceae bacterium]
MISHLQMVTVFISNMQQAVAFYTEKLGFVVVGEYRDEENYFTWVVPEGAKDDPHSTLMGLFEAKAGDPRIGNVDGMVFTAVDIAATYQALKAKGVTFTLELIRHEYGGGDGDQEARFVDPDGNEFLLHT